METFSALLAICAGNSPTTGEFPTQRPVARSFDVFFDLRLNKRLSKHSWSWWFETPSSPLWRHCNEWPVSIQAFLHDCPWISEWILSISNQSVFTFQMPAQYLSHTTLPNILCCNLHKINNEWETNRRVKIALLIIYLIIMTCKNH